MEHDIFISYSSKDIHTAYRIYERLKQEYKVWFDKIEILAGDNIIERVFEGINKSRFLVVLLTSHSVESKWVTEELSAGKVRELENNKIIILPLLYEDCKIPEYLSSKRYIDFRESFEKGIDELISSIVGHERRKASTPELTLDNRKKVLLNAISDEKNLCLAMDFGGTKTYISLLDSEANRIFDKKYPTEGHNDEKKVFEFVKNCIRNTLDDIMDIGNITESSLDHMIRGIGIGFAGPVDFEKGIILDAPNVGIKDFPLAEKLEQTFKIPCFVENDVNLGVLGEAWKGVAAGYNNVVGIIIGTGIGGGIIINGEIYRGRNKTAGEVGHMIVDYDSDKKCSCGQFGCFEALASRKVMGKMISDMKTVENELSRWHEANLGSNEIADYYKQGDKDTIKVIKSATEVCAKAVFSILNVLNPDIIFFGGGFIRQIGDIFIQAAKEEAKKCMHSIYNTSNREIQITLGSLDNPILIGACKMVLDSTSVRTAYSKNEILDAITDDLDGNSLLLLQEFYRDKKSVLISHDPRSAFFTEKLKELRNRGLIRTVEKGSISKSNSVEITKLGTIVAEELL